MRTGLVIAVVFVVMVVVMFNWSCAKLVNNNESKLKAMSEQVTKLQADVEAQRKEIAATQQAINALAQALNINGLGDQVIAKILKKEVGKTFDQQVKVEIVEFIEKQKKAQENASQK
jgi:uncharacterized membrane protein